MPDKYKLMCVLAHPDDESLGTGGTLAKYASQGVETYLVIATRGERGRFGIGPERPEPQEVGRVRQQELLAAAQTLGVKEVHFLDYMDGDLDQVNPVEAIAKIVKLFRQIKPQVVITFAPDGAYGHPDHIAISQLTTSAAVLAADSNYETEGPHKSENTAHRISKLYFLTWTREKWDVYQTAFRDLKITVDGEERRANPWPDWAITTRIDTQDYWATTWKAVSCHKTQMAIYSKLQDLSETQHQAIWGTEEYYRVFSLVNGGRRQESDLFEGIKV